MSLLHPWGSRRRFVATAGLLLGAGGRVGAAAERPSVGAIRWDAWYDPNDGSVARAMETALGQPRYHDRMPFFGSELAADRVRINGDYQPIMDQEIALASRAGLDYWAFVGYSAHDPMSNALKLYLANKSRGKIGFCMIGSIANGGSVDHFSDRTLREVAVMGEEDYVRVLGNRPLYLPLIGFESTNRIRVGWLQRCGEIDCFRPSYGARAKTRKSLYCPSGIGCRRHEDGRC